MIGHGQTPLSGTIHHDVDKNSVMRSDDTMFFDGFLLDVDYGFDWQEILRKAGREVSEVSWQRYVEEYDCSLPQRRRAAPPDWDSLPMGPTKDRSATERVGALRQEGPMWMEVKERTVRLMDHFHERPETDYAGICF